MRFKCEICESRTPTTQCRVCGRVVCEGHIVSSSGVCSVCSSSICAICGENLSIGYCVFCGRLACSDCLIQLDNVRRICKECLTSKFSGDRIRALAEVRELTPSRSLVSYTITITRRWRLV